MLQPIKKLGNNTYHISEAMATPTKTQSTITMYVNNNTNLKKPSLNTTANPAEDTKIYSENT